MPIDVEVNLRIPKVKAPSLDENGYPIDNSTVRFAKMIKVESIPKPGEMLQLTISSGRVFEATVARSDWSEDRSVFIVSCRYANRSMKDEEYTALVNDSDWKMRPLL